MKRKDQVAGMKFVPSSGNVYADLGVKDADAMLVKAQLVTTISRIIRERGLTQAAASKLFGLSQPKLSNILRGQFHKVPERCLIDCLTRLGCDVEIVVKEKPRSRAFGRFSVTSAGGRGGKRTKRRLFDEIAEGFEHLAKQRKGFSKAS